MSDGATNGELLAEWEKELRNEMESDLEGMQDENVGLGTALEAAERRCVELNNLYTARRARIDHLMADNASVTGQLAYARQIVGRAISDLRSIEDVPLGEVEDYVDAVVETLRSVALGARFAGDADGKVFEL